jgi:hypothetical protein
MLNNVFDFDNDVCTVRKPGFYKDLSFQDI